MSNRENVLTPVGRLVQGSLYDPQTTDAEGRPLVVKEGANAGQPLVKYYFALAVQKRGETHWSQTEWGKTIWEIGHKGFPNGQAKSQAFAWKIVDGDSPEPNKAGRRPCDREGYPGHWVLNFSSSFAPGIYTEDGSQQILQKDYINLGDFIQVYGSVQDNGSQQQPGVYLNHSMVAFSRYGNRIILGADPKAVGFGKSPIPAGALSSPPEGRFNPSPAPMAAPVPTPAYTPPVAMPAPMAAPVPPPHTAILNTASVRTMTALANGVSYEQMVSAGWTDTQLIQHGYMLA